jgi:uncharacterized protein (TIGR00290 family)
MYAIATSGGKDSTLALCEAQRKGLSVTHLFHVYGVEYGRVRFHGYKPEMLAAQAAALGLEAIIEPTRSAEFDQDFTAALLKAKGAGLRGVIFGNLWLQDVSDYYRRLVKGAGLEHVEMLFGRPPLEVLRQFVEEGFRAVVTSVWLRASDKTPEHLGREWLGREVDRCFIADIARLPGVDPCGEQGEYHTLCYDGPCFRRSLGFTTHGTHEEPGYVFLDIRPA